MSQNNLQRIEDNSMTLAKPILLNAHINSPLNISFSWFPASLCVYLRLVYKKRPRPIYVSPSKYANEPRIRIYREKAFAFGYFSQHHLNFMQMSTIPSIVGSWTSWRRNIYPFMATHSLQQFQKTAGFHYSLCQRSFFLKIKRPNRTLTLNLDAKEPSSLSCFL